MFRLASLLLIAFVPVVTGQIGRAAQHPVHPLTEAPEHLKTAISKAEAVFAELQKALLSTLMSELEAGGPTQALSVCHTEAEPIARRVAAESGILLGRTSHRLRNADNRPPQWAPAEVTAPTSSRVGDAKPIAVDLGDRVGVLRPIGTVAWCTSCHGSTSELSADVRERLQALYPQDEAVGFREGDLRGWMWAEVPLTR